MIEVLVLYMYIVYILYIIYIAYSFVICRVDLMVEFMISHMAKNFRLDLYR